MLLVLLLTLCSINTIYELNSIIIQLSGLRMSHIVGTKYHPQNLCSYIEFIFNQFHNTNYKRLRDRRKKKVLKN